MKYIKFISPYFLFIIFSCIHTDAWNKRANMPTARMGLTTCVVDGKIYAIGGYEKANAPGANYCISI